MKFQLNEGEGGGGAKIYGLTILYIESMNQLGK